jgi:hypothetical protein
MVVDYNLAKIYKLTSPNGLIYIGSTCEPFLARRLAGHKKAFKQYQKGNFRKVSSFELFEEDIDNVIISLLEKYPCNDKDELNAREGHYIREIECVNKRIAGRTDAQYKEDNREKCKVHDKKYKDKNRDKINEKRRQKYALEHPKVI